MGRLGPLALLPLFADLHGKPALVAGDTPAAAWKAELLAAAGAEVRVAAPEPCAELAELLAGGSLIHLPRPWLPADLDGVALAVADAADEIEARRFADAARAAGAPCNVIDRPAFGTVQFGSIVNRSPVVVGIATAGAAPILAQAIRRRIETLLPPTLAAWAALGARLRAQVMARLPAGPARRAFWEALAERAFGAAPTTWDEAALSRMTTGGDPGGRVTLVGAGLGDAGLGDAGLLTLNAVRALQSADVILFDAEVSDAVLELARREARRMLVGGRGPRDASSQEDINDLMVKLARQGKHVVRLKGGDAGAFGTARAELRRLAAEGIPAAVVPGVTAASAMATAPGRSRIRDDVSQTRFATS